MGCAVASTCLATDSNTSGMIPSVAFKAISTLHTYSLTFKLHALPCSRFYLVIGHRFLTFSVCLNHYHMLATVAEWTQCTKCTKCRQGPDTSRESTARRGQNVVTTKFDMSQFPCYSPKHSEVFCAKPALSSTLLYSALRCAAPWTRAPVLRTLAGSGNQHAPRTWRCALFLGTSFPLTEESPSCLVLI